VIAAVENMESVVIEVAMAVQPAQAAVAHLCLYRLEVFPFQIQGRVEDRLAILTGAEDAVGHQHMEVRTISAAPIAR
jgi:3-deoxy-D-arabino-heptulosonate 7-phosphate (DAHP) synthase